MNRVIMFEKLITFIYSIIIIIKYIIGSEHFRSTSLGGNSQIKKVSNTIPCIISMVILIFVGNKILIINT